MTRSGHMTTLILVIFCLILMTCELVCGIKGCGSTHSSTCGHRGLGAGTRWTDEGHWSCPEDRQAGGTETEWDRKSVKERAEKARAESESCQEAGYGSKSRQVKSIQPVETQERDRDCLFEYQTTSPPWIKAMRGGLLSNFILCIFFLGYRKG